MFILQLLFIGVFTGFIASAFIKSAHVNVFVRIGFGVAGSLLGGHFVAMFINDSTAGYSLYVIVAGALGAILALRGVVGVAAKVRPRPAPSSRTIS